MRAATALLLRSALAVTLCVAGASPIRAYAQEREQDEEAHPDEDDDSGIVVQATRSGRLVKDEPIRVDIVDHEEISEKQQMRPGNISKLLGETPGVRVQTTSPGLGAANVRVQGLKGRYTQILSDGLPLYGGQTPSLGLLQIPPMDLGQVEVIKGAASALYGPSALGGVINLVSRRPDAEPEAELLLNATSRDGQDVAAYGSAPLGDALSASITATYNRQSAQDIDGDGWADMPGYQRWSVRPRLFLEDDGGRRALLTFGAMKERRTGGTLPGKTAPGGAPFVEAQRSRRFDLGLTADVPLEGAGTLHLRASGVTRLDSHRFGSVTDDDRHRTGFAEASINGGSGATTWLFGAAIQADDYRSPTFAAFNYDYVVPGIFVQGEARVTPELTLAGSARWDGHSEYGSHVSPRLSALYRPGPWTVRASYGRGFYAPTPFIDEVEANGLARVQPYARLKAETADTGSLDIGYAEGPFEARTSFFASDISDAVQLHTLTPGRVTLVNANGATRTRGVEVLLKYKWREFMVFGSYVHVDAREPDPDGAGRREVPLTPRNTVGVDAMWERPGRGRIGVEAYYVGSQLLDDNPYRARSRPYVQLGVMGELTIGTASLFVNAENILDVRQTRYDPLLRPARSPAGAWTVDAWAPTDGLVLNAGVRFRFGD